MGLVVVGALCAGLLAGFLAGFGLVRRAQQWCPGCGAAITIAHCPHPIGIRRPPSGRPASGSISSPNVLPDTSSTEPQARTASAGAKA